jgi:hypothetical protein
VEPHALTGPRAVDSSADGVDHAGAVEVELDRRFPGLPDMVRDKVP